MKKRHAGGVWIAPLLLLLLGSLGNGQTMERLKSQVREKTLKNGMKFIVMEQHQAPVVSFHVYADVGSAQEVLGITGISHLLEHMAFKGTTTIGTKNFAEESKVLVEMDKIYDSMSLEKKRLKPDEKTLESLKSRFDELQKKAKEFVINNEYFDMMMQNGDAGINAYTSNDATQYINSLPANRLEFWMAVTSDRFLNPVFREFYKERDVVMEERRLSLETRPNGRLIEDFFAAAFKAHPYHHSVVGHMSDLLCITRADTMDYFKKFYSPANLTAAIAGDVNPEEVFKLAELYFGRIPSGPKPEEIRTEEPEQWGERRVAVSAQSQPILIFGYHRPSVRHKDDLALEALANILGEGRSSRLWESLVKKEQAAVATGAFNGFPGQKYPNLIAFFAIPGKDKSAQECLSLMEAEIEKIKNEEISDQELTKFKQNKKKQTLDQMGSNNSLAAQLTFYDVVLGDWHLLFDEINKIEGLSKEDIQRVAKAYLIKKHRTIGEIVPEEK